MFKTFITLIIILLLTGQNCVAGKAAEHFADAGRYLLPLTAIAYTVDQQDQDGLKQFALSFGSSLALTTLLKHSVNERRPNGSSKNSFPSGHSVWAFSPASFMAKRYGWNQMTLSAYVLATLVATSRVVTRHHYAHDVIAGAVLAHATSYVFTSNYQGDNLTVSLFIGHDEDKPKFVLSLGIAV